MLIKSGKRLDEHSEIFNRELENMKNQSELKNSITEMKIY